MQRSRHGRETQSTTPDGRPAGRAKQRAFAIGALQEGDDLSELRELLRTAGVATVGQAVRCLVNAQRAAHGLAPLRPNRRLRLAAEAHGADMVSHSFFAHVSPFSGAITDRARRAGYLAGTRDWSLGEDIAWGEGDLSTPESIVTAWMNSPAHRAVILDGEFRDAGVGVTAGVPVGASSLPGATFVLDVGAR